MKFIVSILGFALLYTANSAPILEQSTGASGSAATVSTDPKTEVKPEVPSTPLAVEKLTESASKESSSPAPSSTSATEERATSPKENLLPQQSPQQQHLKPSGPSPVEEPAKSQQHIEPSKSETDVKLAPLTVEPAAKPDTIVESVSSSSEKPKELNNQVNAVSVDEPKPVQNEVKSEIPKDETGKSEPLTEEIKAEKVEEKKEEKREDHKTSPILSGVEAKPSEKPILTEEAKRPIPAVSSEEKVDSREKEGEKKEPAKVDHSSESSEEKKPEKPAEGIKKEESAVKPHAEALPTEPSKPLTVAASAQPGLEKTPEKSESEKDVIKREAAKDKSDDKKLTENFGKKEKVKNTPVKEVNKNTKIE